jgi:hypothetical protein
MKFFTVLILLVIISLVCGCESEEIVNVELVYEEYTVVQAELVTDRHFPGVRFTKTQPLGVPYDIKNAEIKNITAYLRINGIQVIPLIYTENGLYKPKYDFYIIGGDTYELFAEQGEKYIYSITKIPLKPVVTSVNYDQNDYHLYADVNVNEGEVYSALWIVAAGNAIRAEDFFSVSSSDDQNSNVEVRTSPIPEEYLRGIYSGTRMIQVFAFDKSFKDYFYTRNSSQQLNDPFIQGTGGAVEWNVIGDKVIGLFIGVTPGNIIEVF